MQSVGELVAAAASPSLCLWLVKEDLVEASSQVIYLRSPVASTGKASSEEKLILFDWIGKYMKMISRPALNPPKNPCPLDTLVRTGRKKSYLQQSCLP